MGGLVVVAPGPYRYETDFDLLIDEIERNFYTFSLGTFGDFLNIERGGISWLSCTLDNNIPRCPLPLEDNLCNPYRDQSLEIFKEELFILERGVSEYVYLETDRGIFKFRKLNMTNSQSAQEDKILERSKEFDDFLDYIEINKDKYKIKVTGDFDIMLIDKTDNTMLLYYPLFQDLEEDLREITDARRKLYNSYKNREVTVEYVNYNFNIDFSSLLGNKYHSLTKPINNPYKEDSSAINTERKGGSDITSVKYKDDEIEWTSSGLDISTNSDKETKETKKKMTLEENYRFAIDNGLNILVEGQHGTAKTMTAQQVVKDLGVTAAYFSASTLDPFVHFIGIPKEIDGKLKFIGAIEWEKIEIIIIDELNRAHPTILNALMEMIQLKTINGKPLPKLRSILAMINPQTDDYTVDALDEALKDRFHMQIKAAPTISKRFFKDLGVPSHTVDKMAAWYRDRLSAKGRNYISPRRLEYAWIVNQKGGDISAVVDEIDTEALNRIFNSTAGQESPSEVIDRYIGLFDEMESDPEATEQIKGMHDQIVQLISKNSLDILEDAWNSVQIYQSDLFKFIPDEFINKKIYWNRDTGAEDQKRNKAILLKLSNNYKSALPNVPSIDEFAEKCLATTNKSIFYAGGVRKWGKYDRHVEFVRAMNRKNVDVARLDIPENIAADLRNFGYRL